MLPGFLSLPAQLILATTPEALASIEYERTLAPFRHLIQVQSLCTQPPGGVLLRATHRLRELRRAVNVVRPDHLCLLYTEGLWQLLAVADVIHWLPLDRSLTIEGWAYRGDFAFPEEISAGARLRRVLFRRMLRSGLFDRLHVDHEVLFEQALQWAPMTSTEVVLTPNPVAIQPPLSTAEARQRLSLPSSGRMVVGTGMIAPRKGMDLLLAAFEIHLRSGRARQDDRLLLAGPHSIEITAMLARSPYRELAHDGRVCSLDRFLTESELFASASAGDLTVAVYPGHTGRSSTILWAAAAGRPSLGTARGCIGHVVRAERLGLTCDELSADAVANRLADALEMEWSSDDETRVRRYAQLHSIERYQATASALVRSRTGSGCLPSRTFSHTDSDQSVSAIARCRDSKSTA
jgi:glycosyltransferase involved in cell wall biosynthesis